MANGFGVYKNITSFAAHVNMPAKDVASLPPGKSAVFADMWPGVQDAIRKGKIIRVGDAPAPAEPLIVPEKS